ncbi:Transcription factor Spt20 protein [Dioscorea alata]|uniref:Transcription factor Spt20 protein n=1 Tax=Dioscorea alata TaxID=55571 RepID=A0ACB7W5K1_DIOAL|nr:Transcription factor Spt20 protein [Dioscorea alata]
MSKDSKLDSNGTSKVFPKVQKVLLRMGTETVVKDMPLISDDAWTYNDLLQAESRIIKALQPVLYLEPKPSLDRLCKAPVLKQLGLGTHGTALKGKHHIGPDAELEYSRQSDRTDALSNASVGNLKSQPFDAPEGEAKCPTQSHPKSMPNVESTKYGIEQASPLTCFHGSVINDPFSSPNAEPVSSIRTARDEALKGSCIGHKIPANFPLAKSDKLIPGVPCLKPTLKRPKQEPQDFDTHQIVTTKRAKFLEPDLQRKIAALCEPGESQDPLNLLCSRSDNYAHPQVMNEEVSGEKWVPNGQNPFPLCLRDVPTSIVKQPVEFETKNIVKSEPLNGTNEQALSVRSSKTSTNLPLASIKPLPPQMYWINASSTIEKPPKKETASRIKKAVGASQVSTGRSLNSQFSRVGGKQMNVIEVSHIMREDASPIQTSKGNVTSVPATSNENAFTNPSSTISLISASQTPSRAKNNSRSNCKNPAPVISANALGGAVIKSEIPNYSKNVLVRTPSLQFLPEIDSVRAIRMNFSRIEVVAKRHGLNKRKVKNDKILKTRSLPDPRMPQRCLIMDKNTEDFIAFAEKKCMSKSILCGSRNTCKIRILSYRRVRILFRDGMPIFVDDSWSKLVLRESDVPDIHKVAAEMLYGDNEQSIHLTYLPTAHHADLYASQFTSLMVREGFELLDDQVRFQPSATPARTSNSRMGSHGPGELPSTGYFPNQSAETTTANSIPTLKCLGYPSQNDPSPMSLNLTRPIELEIAPELSCVPMHQSLNQSFLPIFPKSTLDATTVLMLDQLPNNPRLQHLNLQQFQQQYQQQSIMQQTMPGNNSLGGHFFTSDDQRITEFCSSNNQQIRRGGSAIQAAVLARLNRSPSVGTGVIEGGPRMNPSGGTIWTNDGSPLSPALDMSPSNQNQIRTRTRSNLCSNYDLLHQHQAQQARLQQPENWQRRQLLPQQYSSPAATQMSQCTPNSPMQFISGSAPQQANAGVSVASSPQVSAQIVGSGGSLTSSPMGLKGVGKGSSSGVRVCNNMRR